MTQTTSASREELQKVVLRGYSPGSAPAAGQSQQVDDDDWTPDDGVPTPVNFEHLAAQTLVSPIRRSCIAAITLNTVGLGCSLEPREGMEDESEGAEEGAEVLARLDAMARRDERLGRPSFKRLLSAVQWDRQEVGNGYLEVSRNRTTGEIDGLYHVPGKRIRRRVVKQDGVAKRVGYIMGARRLSRSEATLYYEFGEKVVYDADGRPTPRLKEGSAGRWDRNELLPFRLYTSTSRDYGLPPDAQLAIDYLGDKLAAKSNRDLFDSSSVPPTIIFIRGKLGNADGQGNVEVEVDPSLIQAVANTMRGGSGRERVAVIPLPPGVEPPDTVDLSINSERDLGAVAYRSDNRRRTLGAWRVSPVFVADIEDAGKYTAEVERAITKEQVFDPEQAEVGEILDRIIGEIAPHLTIRFDEIEIKGDEARRQSANDLADRGRITNGEYREAHGFAPLPEANEGEEPDPDKGEVEFGWNAQLVDAPAAALDPFGDEAVEDEIVKRSARAALAEGIEDEFDRALDSAVRALGSMADDAEIRPLVIEKVDGEIQLRPYTPSMNGGGE